MLFPAQLLGENMNMAHYTANGATGITYTDEQIITPGLFQRVNMNVGQTAIMRLKTNTVFKKSASSTMI